MHRQPLLLLTVILLEEDLQRTAIAHKHNVTALEFSNNNSNSNNNNNNNNNNNIERDQD
jgi:hypothetical protein